MPLLSHDKYEVEYEFVDTHDGIKTKSNVLRGWPAVIFAQAIDYSHYQRYPEIQRRFIVTNPKMSKDKYEQAVDLIGDKYGLPDFAYQQKIVSDSDKEKVREIIRGIKEKILGVCDRVEQGKNNLIIPFREIITKLMLPKEKALDMTIATRLFTFLSLLALVNIDKRPRLMLRKDGDLTIQTIPFALFEDLQEALSLIEYSDGIRPYVLEWYNEVFLEGLLSKKEPDSKINVRDEATISEKIIALTTEQLVNLTFEKQNKKLSTKQILENFVNPLINQSYIDKMQSELDKRANVYYPVTITKNRKLFEMNQSNNFLQSKKINIENPTLYPTKQYIISEIQGVLEYSSGKGFYNVKIKSHDGKEISIQKLVEIYYKDPEKYFDASTDINNGNRPALPLISPVPALPLLMHSNEYDNITSSKIHLEQTLEENNFSGISDDYLKNNIISIKSQENHNESASPKNNKGK